MAKHQLEREDVGTLAGVGEWPLRQITLPSGQPLQYVEAGSGARTLLFVHGLASDRLAWARNLRPLSEVYRVLALDLPGFGGSAPLSETASMRRYAELLLEFAEGLAPGPVYLLGHSMGGQIAITAALLDPERFAALILLAPAGFETFSPLEQQWFRFFYTPAMLKATTAEQVRRNLETNFFEMPPDAEELIAGRLALFDDPDAFEYYCRLIPECVLAMLDEPVYDRLPDLQLPVLVVYGSQDQLIPNRLLHPTLGTEDVAQSGAVRIADVQLNLIDRAGHFVQYEQPAQVNELIRGFVGLSGQLGPSEEDLAALWLQALDRHDWEELTGLWTEDIRIDDPLFGPQDAAEALRKWQWLVEYSEEYHVHPEQFRRVGNQLVVEWTLHYFRKRDGHSIQVPVQSRLSFEGTRISAIEHELPVADWARQEYGILGSWLFQMGVYRRFLRRKIR